ncbi:calpain-12 [Eucyclogobius newberryi]|uniref:calpain-12 n=1 Tax=Eucyclogobius newberryi TaxID=166745 RepID=UPI003B599F84
MTVDGEAAAPGSLDNPLKFRGQCYETLLQACLASRQLFSDPEFPAVHKSIGMPEDPDPQKAIKWLRPTDITKNAVFVEGTTETTDICQGQLGNCWLLAALSCLTMHPKLFVKVVPANQSLSKPYAGIFHFKFWQYGEWVEVVVDDRLPVRQGRLLFSYSHTRNEFWSALVEKAYAKLIGSYGCLKGGNISEGMEDFTGGIAYTRPVLSRTPPVFWRLLTSALSRGSLLSCFIQAKSYKEVGFVTKEGLIKGHAYAITDTDKVKKGSDEILLYKLRNPWGFVEYLGPWSDKSAEWDNVDEAERNRVELKRREDGEFWISAEDFSQFYNIVELCSVNPDMLEGESAPQMSWTITEHEGFWVSGCSAGGSRRFRRSFFTNPQYELILSEKDLDNEDDDDSDEEDGEGEEDDEDNSAVRENKMSEKQMKKTKQCTVLVELLQKDRRQKDKVNFLYIAFHIYKVPPELQGQCLDSSFFSKTRPVTRSGKYKAQRGVWRKVHLDPGYYVIVASTYKPNQPGEFFIRIFSKTGNTLGTQDLTCSSDFLQVMALPPSPEDHARVEKTFDETASGTDKLNVKELRKLLNSVLNKDYHLPMETCRQLIFAENNKGHGSLNRKQAEDVLTSLRSLKDKFLKFDENSSGTMSSFELRNALTSVGLQCDAKVVQLLGERFASGELQMPFHGFVTSVTRLNKLFALYDSETSPEVKARGINDWLLKFLVI